MRRTRQGCYRAGMAVGELKSDLERAHFAASEGAGEVAREILKSSRHQASKLVGAGLLTKGEADALRMKLVDAAAQPTPSMVERKAKYIIWYDLKTLEERAKKACLGRI